ncbi:MAG: PAS domain S-box protein [Haloarculaceae archaeon]
MGQFAGDTVRVLHVDDDPAFAEITSTYLEREDGRFDVETARSAEAGLERITDDEFDCVVSDYDMPGTNGIELLEAVREDNPDLPFVLFTGKGSEAIASEAIAAGVTDYLQKTPGTEQYELLTHRIANAVEQYRATQRAVDLDRIRRILGNVNQALLRADSREEIDRRVCEIVSTADPYSLAWVGGVDGDRVEVRTSAGQEADYLDEITVTVDESATGRGPVGRAVREGRVAVTQNVQADPAFEPWREEATERGYRAVAAVPLEYGDDRYGLLAVYADRVSAFDERERELLSELGGDVAHAHRRAELRGKLEKRETHLEQAQSVADLGSWHRDFESGDLYWSEEVYRIFGIPEDATPTHDRFIEAVHPEDRDFVEQCWAAAKGGEPYDIEHRVVVDGETRWVRERAQIEFDDEGGPIEGIGVVQDITERKEDRRKLDETTQKLEALDRAFPDVALLVDADGTYLGALTGEQTESLLYHGYQGAYADSRTIRDTFSEEVADRALGAIRHAVEMGEIQTLEYRLDVPSGDRWFEARIAPLETDPDGDEPVVWVARDVTERREREQQLERERNRFTGLFENMVGPVAYTEFEGSEPVVKAVNGAFEETFGVEGADAVGQSLDALVVPPDRAEQAEEINARVRENEIFQVEVERETADGLGTFNLLSVPLSPGTSPARGFAVYRDITERERRKVEIERERDRLAAVFDAVPHPITEVELHDCEPIVQSVNDAFEEVFGYSEGQVAGQSVDEFIVPDDRTAEAETINRMTEDASTIERQVERTTADGDRRTFLFRAARVDETGDTHWLSTYIDITEREQRAQELEQQNERLDEFASIVSHDLRSPLHIAGSRLTLARDECDSDHLDGVENALGRMEGLIEDLLTLARSERPVVDREAVALASLFESCWGIVETADATLAVETDATIRADRSRLRQLAENLVRNSVEHGGADVTVTVGDLDGGFFVADDGPGIPAEEREQVFESGYSTVDGGTGIGLDIVSQVADAHGWTVEVIESEGGGARFEITGVDSE